MEYCTREHITDLLLADYVGVAEAKNPGIVERTIAAVSREVTGMLVRRYVTPLPEVPDLLRYITSVIAAYRIVQAITSLVDTEGSTDNEWIPLQRQWKHVTTMLNDLVDGRLKLPPPAVELNPDREEASVAVVTRPPLFDRRGW